jgi:hypothetical protein
LHAFSKGELSGWQGRSYAFMKIDFLPFCRKVLPIVPVKAAARARVPAVLLFMKSSFLQLSQSHRLEGWRHGRYAD